MPFIDSKITGKISDEKKEAVKTIFNVKRFNHALSRC